jgi:hypothetical protein
LGYFAEQTMPTRWKNSKSTPWIGAAVLCAAAILPGCSRWGGNTLVNHPDRPVGLKTPSERWNTDVWGFSESAKQVERNLGVH